MESATEKIVSVESVLTTAMLMILATVLTLRIDVVMAMALIPKIALATALITATIS